MIEICLSWTWGFWVFGFLRGEGLAGGRLSGMVIVLPDGEAKTLPKGGGRRIRKKNEREKQKEKG